MNKFSLLWKAVHYRVHKNRDLFQIRSIHFKLLHSVTVTIRIILLLCFCNELCLYMESISLPCSQKRQERPISNQPYSIHTLTGSTFIKISVSQRVLVYTVNIHMGEWRYGSTHSYRRGWMEVSGRLYCSAALSSG